MDTVIPSPFQHQQSEPSGLTGSLRSISTSIVPIFPENALLSLLKDLIFDLSQLSLLTIDILTHGRSFSLPNKCQTYGLELYVRAWYGRIFVISAGQSICRVTPVPVQLRRSGERWML